MRWRATTAARMRRNRAGTLPPRYEFLARVRAAFFAAADRAAGDRFRAAARACRERALFEAACVPSRWSALVAARERFRDGLRVPFCLPFAVSRAAFRRVSSETVPFFGGGSFTPARRAFESPMAIACLADRAPCFPSRISSISSRTNSPACVEAALPSRFALAARLMVCFPGILCLRDRGCAWFRVSRIVFDEVSCFTAALRALSSYEERSPRYTWLRPRPFPRCPCPHRHHQ